MLRRLALVTVALLGVVSAQLTVTSPSSSDWWGEYQISLRWFSSLMHFIRVPLQSRSR